MSGTFHGFVIPLRAVPGARAFRVIHPIHQTIADHAHDWCCLTLHMLGSYTECFDGGEVHIAAPSAVFHPAGEAHANLVEENGLETVSVQFDRAWFRSYPFSMDRSRLWAGGAVARAAHWLAAAWSNPKMSDGDLSVATSWFLEFAKLKREDVCYPDWIDYVQTALNSDTPPGTNQIARQLGLHPAWLARAYRMAIGEGMQTTIRRKRIERATTMLRNSDASLRDIAAAANFSDQSHMNRVFRSVSGRTPLQVRAEREMLTVFNTGVQ